MYEQNLVKVSGEAAADLARYVGVKLDSNGKMALASAGAKIIGLTQEDVSAGEIVPVATDGVSFAVAGAAVTIMAEVEIDAAGKVIPLAAGKSIGIAMSAAAGADELINILLK